MEKIKVTVRIESAEHAEWQKAVSVIEDLNPEERTDEQWMELARLNREEPEYGDKEMEYYIPTFESAPAITLQKLPKHLFDKNGKLGIDQAMEFTTAYLGLYMPKRDINRLSISQINEIGAMLNPSGEH